MSELDLTPAVRITRIVAAGVIHRVRICAAVRLRARQDVMRIRHVADAIDDSAFFGQRKLLAHTVSEPSLLDRVAVQLSDVHRNHLALLVVPRTIADAVTYIDGTRALRAH